MVSILESLGLTGGQGGYGGLLDALMYRSPIQTPADAPQPQYDAMGNVTVPAFENPVNPFGPVPQANMPTPAQFQPPSAFTMGAAPVAGISSAPLAPAAPAQPQAPSAPPQPHPLRAMNIGSYQMPQVGSDADYTPTAPTDVSAQSRAPAQPQQAPQKGMTLPTFLSNQGGLAAGLRGFANNAAAGPLGALIGGLGSAAGLQDPAQQNVRAQYEALVPIVGHQKAMLAVLNPEAGKTILAQALEKKQYGFLKGDGDTVLRTDPLTGKAEVAYGGGDDNRTGVAGPDGKIIPYPAGLDAAGRKVFANEIAKANADASIGKKTEVQGSAEQFANRMESAEKSFGKVGGAGLGLSGAAQGVAGVLPGGNFLKTENYQKMEQSKREWVTALLRKESGAAIGPDEYTQYDRQFFPQPGDAPSVVAQKAEARRVAVEALKKSAGPSYKSPSQDPPSSAVRKYNPVTGRIE